MAGVAQVWLTEDELEVLQWALNAYPVNPAHPTFKDVYQKVKIAHTEIGCADDSCRRAEGPAPNSPMYQHGYDDGFEDGYATGWQAAGGA